VGGVRHRQIRGVPNITGIGEPMLCQKEKRVTGNYKGGFQGPLKKRKRTEKTGHNETALKKKALRESPS